MECTCWTHPLTGNPSTRERKETCHLHGGPDFNQELDLHADTVTERYEAAKESQG